MPCVSARCMTMAAPVWRWADGAELPRPELDEKGSVEGGGVIGVELAPYWTRGAAPFQANEQQARA
jgi:pyruvate/2-oxoglutarate dehydrogenase complex dihydrolipoamide dehydrogenase (E3) component